MNIVTPFPFDFMITMGWLGFFLFLGAMLRSKIGFLKRYLVPSCIIGGVIGMACNMAGLFGTGFLRVDNASVQMVAFHFFGLYFAATALNTGKDPCNPDASKGASKRYVSGGFWIGSSQYTIQQTMIVICAFIMLAMNMFMGTDFIASTAQLLPSGFASGPGPAMTTGKIWDDFLGEGRNFASLGLTTGSLGFLFAYIIGIPLANYYHRKRKLQVSLEETASLAEQQGYYENECGPALGHETMHASNVDSLAFQAGVIFFVYLLAAICAYGLVIVLGNSPAVGMVWGLFFLFPLLTGLLVRYIIEKLGYSHLINRKLNNRIMGALIDFITIGSFFGIVISNVGEYLYFLMFGIAAIIVLLLIMVPFMTKFVNNFREERVLFLTGLMTGTAATGIFLVRIIDPDGKSPIPFEVAMMPIFSLLLAIPLTPIGYMEVMFGRTIWEFLIATSITIICYAALAVLATKLLNKSVKTYAPTTVEI